jgi:hypothetical protein
LLFWADTHILGKLCERNRDIIGISRGILLLYPSIVVYIIPLIARETAIVAMADVAVLFTI